MADSPCGRCREQSVNGVICDSCNEAWCLPCINQCSPDLQINDVIYERLTELGEFHWKCGECTVETSLEQLERI